MFEIQITLSRIVYFFCSTLFSHKKKEEKNSSFIWLLWLLSPSSLSLNFLHLSRKALFLNYNSMLFIHLYLVVLTVFTYAFTCSPRINPVHTYVYLYMNVRLHRVTFTFTCNINSSSSKPNKHRL